ncbi:MAG TPA: GntR family transcriptional regulator [Terriglobales bacterium]|nr:GntR family transcriptional regulator [Terriglobales bacterium]
MQWSLNKQSKVPLYLQLRDLATYHISTGTLHDKQQMPTIHALAGELSVNFETVRKAYKELEREGLVFSERGRGTFVNGHKIPKTLAGTQRDRKSELTDSVKRAIRELLQMGTSAEQIQSAVAQVLRERKIPFVVFSECNPLQNSEISEVLQNYLELEVRPVLLEDLKDEIATLTRNGETPSAIITTGFHIHEVRNQIGDQPFRIEFVVTNMSPETRRELEKYDKQSRFGFVCRDAESIFFKDVLKAELCIKSEIAYCMFREKSKLTDLIKHSDVLLVTPTVYQELKEAALPGSPVFNVLDRVDPMSLKMVKDSIVGDQHDLVRDGRKGDSDQLRSAGSTFSRIPPVFSNKSTANQP